MCPLTAPWAPPAYLLVWWDKKQKGPWYLKYPCIISNVWVTNLKHRPIPATTSSPAQQIATILYSTNPVLCTHLIFFLTFIRHLSTSHATVLPVHLLRLHVRSICSPRLVEHGSYYCKLLTAETRLAGGSRPGLYLFSHLVLAGFVIPDHAKIYNKSIGFTDKKQLTMAAFCTGMQKSESIVSFCWQLPPVPSGILCALIEPIYHQRQWHMLTVAIVVIQIQLIKSFLNCNFVPFGCLLFLCLNLEVSSPSVF